MLRAKRDATLADLRNVLADTRTSLAMGLAESRTRDRIYPTNTNDLVGLYSTPVSAFAESAVVAKALAEALIENKELKAVSHDLGIPMETWTTFVREYSSAFVRVMTRRALNELCESNAVVFGSEVIVAIEENEAYPLNGRDGHYDMVKFYGAGTGKDRDARIQLARRYWKKRRDSGYTYDRNV
jgi:hypothetical protein